IVVSINSLQSNALLSVMNDFAHNMDGTLTLSGKPTKDNPTGASTIHTVLHLSPNAALIATKTTIDAVVANQGLLWFSGTDNFLSNELHTTRGSLLILNADANSDASLKSTGFVNRGVIGLRNESDNHTAKLEIQSPTLVNETT